MTKREMKLLILEASKELKIANIYMKYNENYYLIPVKTSERLFLAINE